MRRSFPLLLLLLPLLGGCFQPDAPWSVPNPRVEDRALYVGTDGSRLNVTVLGLHPMAAMQGGRTALFLRYDYSPSRNGTGLSAWEAIDVSSGTILGQYLSCDAVEPRNNDTPACFNAGRRLAMYEAVGLPGGIGAGVFWGRPAQGFGPAVLELLDGSAVRIDFDVHVNGACATVQWHAGDFIAIRSLPWLGGRGTEDFCPSSSLPVRFTSMPIPFLVSGIGTADVVGYQQVAFHGGTQPIEVHHEIPRRPTAVLSPASTWESDVVFGNATVGAFLARVDVGHAGATLLSLLIVPGPYAEDHRRPTADGQVVGWHETDAYVVVRNQTETVSFMLRRTTQSTFDAKRNETVQGEPMWQEQSVPAQTWPEVFAPDLRGMPSWRAAADVAERLSGLSVGGGTFGITAFPAGNIVTVPALMAERRAPGFDLLVPLVDDSDPDAGLVPVPYVTFSTATGQVLEVHGRAAVVAPAFVS